MKCFHPLNLKIPLLQDENFVLEKWTGDKPSTWKVWFYPSEEILSKDMINWWTSHGCIPTHALVFHAHPHSSLSIHIDDGGPNAWSCNWTFGEAPWMTWHKSKTNGDSVDGVVLQENNTDKLAKIALKLYTKDMIEFNLEQTQLHSPTIVRVGIPHGGFNNTDRDGWIVSVRFRSDMSFFKAVEKFWSIK